jgi:U3 small nucleolar RNA-associated protein 13
MADAVVVDPAILSNIKFASVGDDDANPSSGLKKSTVSKAWRPERTISAVWSGGNFEFSKNAEFAYSLHDGKVHVSNTENMNVERVIEFENEFFVTFTTRGDLLITTGKNGGLRVWNLITGTCLKYIGTGGSIIIDMQLDASATYLAWGTADRKVKVFDIRRNKVTHEFMGHRLSVNLIKWLPNKERKKDRMMVFSASEDGTIKIWDLILNAWVGTLNYHRSQIPSIVFTNDCKTLIVSSRDQKLSFWNLKDNKFNRLGAIQLEEDVEGMQYVNLTLPDSKTIPFLITGGTNGILKILDINNQKYVYSEEDPLKQEIERVFYLKKSNTIMTLTNDQVLTYYQLSINNETSLPSLSRLYSLCLYNDEIIDVKYLRTVENHIVMCSNSELVKIVDLATQRNKLLTGHEDIVIAVDVHEDIFVTGSKDKTWRVWKVIQDEGVNQYVCMGVFQGHNMSITSLAIEPKKGSYFVSSSQDNTIKKWGLTEILNQDYSKHPEKYPIVVNEAQVSEVAHQKYINVVRVSPGEKNKLVATASHDRCVKIWSAGNLELKSTLKGHKRGIWDIEFSPYERIIASASSDKTIKLWNVATGQCINTLEGHLNSAVKVLWINEGLQLFSAGSDGSCKIWNVKKSTWINTFDEHEDKIWAMDSFGDKLITGGADSKLIEWRDVTQEVEEEEYKEKSKQAKEERILSSMIYEGKYKEAAIQAFKLKKNRDLFSVIEMVLDQTKDKSNADHLNDVVMSVLDNEDKFESQFHGIQVKDTFLNSINSSELIIRDIVKEMMKIDSMRLLEMIRDLNVHQKYCKIAQILLYQIFKLLGLSKFIDFIDTQVKEYLSDPSKDSKAITSSLQSTGLKKAINEYALQNSSKITTDKLNEIMPIISFYSQKHFERIQRTQKLSYLVSFVVSKFTVAEEKQQLREEFSQTKKKRDIKALEKARES